LKKLRNGSLVDSTDTEGLFTRYDQDRDGVITIEEATNMFMDMMGETEGTPAADTQAQIMTYFKQADVNGDGVLSPAEWQNFCSTVNGLATVLGAGVSQNEGETTPRKMRTAVSPRPEHPDEEVLSISNEFRRFDVNNDARLDVQEAQALIKNMSAKMGLTTDWVTEKFITDQVARVDSDGDADTLTEDEFIAFMENMNYFLSMMGPLTVNPNPPEDTVKNGEGTAASGTATDVADEPAAARSKSTCAIL